MQTQRDYLASLNPPLAKPGSRGRFSLEAKLALASAEEQGLRFADGPRAAATVDTEDELLVPRPAEAAVYPIIKGRPVVRSIKSVQGYTDTGALVSSDICFACAQHVTRCGCKQGIVASPIVSRWAKDSIDHGAPIDSA